MQNDDPANSSNWADFIDDLQAVEPLNWSGRPRRRVGFNAKARVGTEARVAASAKPSTQDGGLARSDKTHLNAIPRKNLP